MKHLMRSLIPIAVLLATGCAAQAPAVVTGAAARTHVETAQRIVRQVAQDMPAARPRLAIADDSCAKAIEQIDADTENVRKIERQHRLLAEAHAALEARWYVRWGRWIERILWMLAIGWLGAGVAAVILGIGNPLGWAYKASREIVRLVPLMNPFAWMRDALSRRKHDDHGASEQA